MGKVDLIGQPAGPASRTLSAADVLIAIPTFNNEETIATTLKAARAALFQFPKQKVVIAQFDGGSSDSTIDRAQSTLESDPSFIQASYPIYALHNLADSHHLVPGKDSAYRTIF